MFKVIYCQCLKLFIASVQSFFPRVFKVNYCESSKCSTNWQVYVALYCVCDDLYPRWNWDIFESHFFIYISVYKNIIINSIHENIWKCYIFCHVLILYLTLQRLSYNRYRLLYLMYLWRYRTVYQMSYEDIICPSMCIFRNWWSTKCS